MASAVHVAFCIDRAMLKPVAAAMLSLADNARAPLHIHACVGPDEEAAKAMHTLLSALGVAFDVNTAAPELGHGLPFISPYGAGSTAAYRRIFLGQLYAELDRILYLDADVMACRDLGELWRTDLEGHAFGAVPDPWWQASPARASLFPDGYFNSGVLLQDLRRWRERNIAQRVIEYVLAWKSGDRIGVAGDAAALTEIWGFQSEMNAALAGQWRALPPEWNASIFHGAPSLASSRELSRARENPAIVHFMGHEKPWDDAFAALTDSHLRYQDWRVEADRALPNLAWPGTYAARTDKRRRRRALSMRLVAAARARGVGRATLVGTLENAGDAIAVAREAGIAIEACAFRDPGPLRAVAAVEILSFEAALARGHHTFLLAMESGVQVVAGEIAGAAREHGILPLFVAPDGGIESQPAQLRLEATSHCQLRCPSCPTATGAIDEAVGRGTLDPEAFETLLARNPHIRSVELSNYGEAMLHPRLVEILEIAQTRGVAITLENGVNFNHVRAEVLEALVRTGVKSVRLSIDGASQETYAQYRRDGDFTRVMANILLLVARKRRAQSELPRLTWQFVVFEHNAREIEQARRLAAGLGMRFVTKLSWDDERAAGGKTRGEQLARTGEFYLHTICEHLWHAPQINWNGDVLGCGRNFWGKFGGNAVSDGLGEALNGEAIRHARRALMGREEARAESPCASCEIYRWRRETGRWIVPNQE